jgi:hypothetical protein
MVHKATAPEAAERVLEARELALAGAASSLIERLTGFSTRFVRGIAREYGGTFSCKPRDPHRWLRDRQRQAHVPYVVLFYENQRSTLSLSKRLLDTYWSYRTVIHPGVLSFNDCALVVDLYEARSLWARQCRRCPLTFFVVAESPLCPKCRLKERVFCPQCGRQKSGTRLREGAYCVACSSPSLAQSRRTSSAHGSVGHNGKDLGVALVGDCPAVTPRLADPIQVLTSSTG